VTKQRGVGALSGILLLLFPAASGLAAGQPREGVAVDLGRVAIREPLLPGGGYTLPTLGVRNPGTVRTRYRMAVAAIRGRRAAPQESWFRFSPTTFTLAPGDTRPVRVKLSIPPGADPGDYEALVGARIANDKPGPRVGAMAASHLTFTVDASSTLAAWTNWLESFFGDHAPWSYVTPGLIAFAAMLWWLRKRFKLRLLVERRT
jgi:hypothetical protein